MPRYDICCWECDYTFEHICKVSELDNLPKCPECGGGMRTVITTTPAEDWFKPHVNENFDGTPIEVRSRSHLKELCDKHGVTSRAIGDHRNIKEI